MASIVNTIMEVAKTRLQATTDVEGVYRPKKQGDFPVRDKVVVLTHSDIETDEENSCAGNPPRTAWIIPIRVSAIIVPDDDDNESIETRMDDFIVACSFALTNADDWHQFGGNAINATLGPSAYFNPADDSARGVYFICRVTYRVEETNQNTLA